MDWWKFESLLENSALYLCRGDHLQDRFEGSYSREQIRNLDQWLEKKGNIEVIASERDDRQNDQIRTYISCWCVGDTDLDLMWKGFVQNSPGIALRTTVAKLESACDEAIEQRPLDLSMVRYYDQAGGEQINYEGSPAIFFHKDNHFRLENELRIVYRPNVGQPPDHEWLPVNLQHLVDGVVLSPKAPECCAAEVRRKLDNVGLQIVNVEYSRDDRPVAK